MNCTWGHVLDLRKLSVVKEVTTGLIAHSGLNNVLEDETRNLWNYDTNER